MPEVQFLHYSDRLLGRSLSVKEITMGDDVAVGQSFRALTRNDGEAEMMTVDPSTVSYFGKTDNFLPNGPIRGFLFEWRRDEVKMARKKREARKNFGFLGILAQSRRKPLKRLDSWKEIIWIFLPPDLVFLPPGLDFPSSGLDCPSLDLDFLS